LKLKMKKNTFKQTATICGVLAALAAPVVAGQESPSELSGVSRIVLDYSAATKQATAYTHNFLTFNNPQFTVDFGQVSVDERVDAALRLTKDNIRLTIGGDDLFDDARPFGTLEYNATNGFFGVSARELPHENIAAAYGGVHVIKDPTQSLTFSGSADTANHYSGVVNHIKYNEINAAVGGIHQPDGTLRMIGSVNNDSLWLSGSYDGAVSVRLQGGNIPMGRSTWNTDVRERGLAQSAAHGGLWPQFFTGPFGFASHPAGFDLGREPGDTAWRIEYNEKFDHQVSGILAHRITKGLSASVDAQYQLGNGGWGVGAQARIDLSPSSTVGVRGSYDGGSDSLGIAGFLELRY